VLTQAVRFVHFHGSAAFTIDIAGRKRSDGPVAESICSIVVQALRYVWLNDGCVQ
jgi:hypothetical protein